MQPLRSRHTAVAQPLCSRYAAAAQPLHNRHTAVTQYRAVAQPSERIGAVQVRGRSVRRRARAVGRAARRAREDHKGEPLQPQPRRVVRARPPVRARACACMLRCVGARACKGVCVRACVHACVRACVRALVRGCVRACLCARLCVCLRACVGSCVCMLVRAAARCMTAGTLRTTTTTPRCSSASVRSSSTPSSAGRSADEQLQHRAPCARTHAHASVAGAACPRDLIEDEAASSKAPSASAAAEVANFWEDDARRS
jgi:hypothetical protein